MDPIFISAERLLSTLKHGRSAMSNYVARLFVADLLHHCQNDPAQIELMLRAILSICPVSFIHHQNQFVHGKLIYGIYRLSCRFYARHVTYEPLLKTVLRFGFKPDRYTIRDILFYYRHASDYYRVNDDEYGPEETAMLAILEVYPSVRSDLATYAYVLNQLDSFSELIGSNWYQVVILANLLQEYVYPALNDYQKKVDSVHVYGVYHHPQLSDFLIDLETNLQFDRKHYNIQLIASVRSILAVCLR